MSYELVRTPTAACPSLAEKKSGRANAQPVRTISARPAGGMDQAREPQVRIGCRRRRHGRWWTKLDLGNGWLAMTTAMLDAKFLDAKPHEFDVQDVEYSENYSCAEISWGSLAILVRDEAE